MRLILHFKWQAYPSLSVCADTPRPVAPCSVPSTAPPRLLESKDYEKFQGGDLNSGHRTNNLLARPLFTSLNARSASERQLRQQRHLLEGCEEHAVLADTMASLGTVLVQCGKPERSLTRSVIVLWV